MPNLHKDFTKIIKAGRGTLVSSEAIAAKAVDRIPKAILPLQFDEMRNRTWGSRRRHSYQIIHTIDDTYRIRFNGKVICRNIKGFHRAEAWANTHNRKRVMMAFGVSIE